MCDTLLCIHAYFHSLNYVRVILMWSWYLCHSDIYVICDMCALYFDLYICHVTCLYSFALLPRFYSDANELYLLYSSLFHIYWVHHVGLGHISLPNSFVLIIKSLYEPSMLKTSLISFTYSRLCCHQSLKMERLKASRPPVGFRWLMTTRDYYD